MDIKMDPKKQCLIINVVNFLQEELIKGNLNDERKESVEVAIQCLETAFEIDDEAKQNLNAEYIDLLSLVKYKAKIELTLEQISQGEDHKTKGNLFMKNQEYQKALEEYSKAIAVNPHNAVYFCNRAAAYSRLEQHLDAIADCNEAIKLDPTYGKAYGRLGIAYSNLNQFENARTAYLTALKYDPKNQMYETNLKLAEDRLASSMVESAAPPEHRPLDISQFMNNPNLINMATNMLSDPNFRDIMSGIMNNGGETNLDALLQAGHTLATRMQTVDPNFVDGLRRAFETQGGRPNSTNTDSTQTQQGPDDKNNTPPQS